MEPNRLYQYAEREEVIRLLLRDNIWDERLLSTALFGHLQRLLRPKEFFLVEEMVNKIDIEELAKLRGIKVETLKRDLRRIKTMIEQGIRNDSPRSRIFSSKRRKKDDDKQGT